MRHVCDLPQHQYIEVDRRYLSRGQHEGWEEAVWFAVSAVPHRAWGCTVMLKCGALYRGLPLHAIVHDPIGKVIEWTLPEAQRWDCFGYDFITHRHGYLRELDCSAWIAPSRKWLPGAYLFTADFSMTATRWSLPRPRAPTSSRWATAGWRCCQAITSFGRRPASPAGPGNRTGCASSTRAGMPRPRASTMWSPRSRHDPRPYRT